MMDNNYQESTCLNLLEKSIDDESVAPIDLPFLLLKTITEDFSENQRIGSGGFGAVYRGALQNGIVAAKKLHNKIDIQEEHFQREIACLIQIKHKNIVRFLGYCSKKQYVVTRYEGKLVRAEVRHMLLCFEYLSKGSLDRYLTKAPSELQWTVRYQMIKGICDGVGYLHQNRIIHMDLKPQNILLDDSMVPKIADFGLSRRFSENQSRTITENIVGSLGYMAPEFLRSGRITFKTDTFSLGVIIIEILMGSKECPRVDKVLERWANAFGASERHLLLEQVKVCAEIGINCMDDDPGNRPAIHDIIGRLETDISNSCSLVRSIASTAAAGPVGGTELKSITVSSALYQREQSALVRFDKHYRLAKKACKPMRISAYKASGETTTESSPGLSESELLDVHRPVLTFLFDDKKPMDDLLNLINKTDRYVLCWIIPQLANMYTGACSYGYAVYILDPKSTATLRVTMVQQEKLPLDAGMFEILIISMCSKSDLEYLKPSVHNDYPKKIDDDLLKRVEELGGEVHAAMLSVVVVCPPGTEIIYQPLSSVPKMISRILSINNWFIEQLDVHPTQPWILMCALKYLAIWDYEKQEFAIQLDFLKEAGKLFYFRHISASVTSVGFIPRRQWFAAGDGHGYIHIYTCLEFKEIKRLKSNSRSAVTSLAIHPTYSYLLSACQDGVVQLWDWDMGWICSRKIHLFSANSTVSDKHILVKFGPNDTHTITTCEEGGTPKVWSIHPSAEPITTIEQNLTLMRYNPAYDHVFTEVGRSKLVTMTSKHLTIWDLQTGAHVHTLGNDQHSLFTAVACHPTLPLIVAGSKSFNSENPVLHFWNSTYYRTEIALRFASGKSIRYIGLVDTMRIVIGMDADGGGLHIYSIIEVIEVDMESLACQK